MKETLKVIVVLALFAVSAIGGCALAVAHWQECRRLHPWWYCAAPR